MPVLSDILWNYLYNKCIKLINEKKFNYALKLLNYTLKTTKNIFGETDQRTAIILQTLGQVNYELSFYSESEKYYKESLNIFEKFYGHINENAVFVILNLGVIYETISKHEDAEFCFADAIDIVEKLKNYDQSKLFIPYYRLGILYFKTGQYYKAEIILTKAKIIIENSTGKESLEAGLVIDTLAWMKFTRGEFFDIESEFKKAISIFEKNKENNIIYLSSSYSRLALFYRRYGRYKESEKLLLKCVEIYKNIYGENHTYVSAINKELAQLYIDIGEIERPKVILKTELKNIIHSIGINCNETANILNLLSFINLIQGNYNAAERIQYMSINIYNKTFGKEYSDLAESYINYAFILQNCYKYDLSEIYYKQAKELIDKSIKIFHPVKIILNLNLCIFYYNKNRFSEFDASFDVLVKIIKAYFGKYSIFSIESERLQYIQSLDSIFYYFFYHNLISNYSRIENNVRSFELWTWKKGLIFSGLQNQTNKAINKAEDVLLKKIEELKTDKSDLSDLIYCLSNLKSKDKEIQKRYTEDIISLESKVLEKEKEVIQMLDISENDILPSEINWLEIRNRLSADQVIVEYISFSLNKDNSYYGAFLIHSESVTPEFILLCTEDELTEALIEYQINIFSNPDHLSHKNSLYRKIWKPLDSVVNSFSNVFVSPDGLLNNINFNILIDDQGRFLNDCYNFIILNCSKDLLRGEFSIKNNNVPVLIGAPNLKNITGDNVVNEGKADRYSKNSKNNSQSFVNEVISVSEIFRQKNIETRIFVNNNATKENLFKIKSPGILHIAAHGYYSKKVKYKNNLSNINNMHGLSASFPENPLFRSGLYLAMPDKDEYAVFTAYEASHLDLRDTELVVLSACDSGLGDIISNEGVFGLKRAFQIAGTKSMVISLWMVPDKETSEFMTLFYKILLSGKDKTAAFRGAQIEIRKIVKERYGSEIPFYWGGFVLIGN